jgi:hypothetical protein
MNSYLPPLPTNPPWKDVEQRAYANPEEATQVLLYGIIADGLANTRQMVTSLANIQYEVGLPIKHLTEGERYALKTYGFDGWGNPFRFTVDDYGEYSVTSAGADGSFGTGDDTGITTHKYRLSTWDKRRWAFFMRKDENEYVLLFHRWPGRQFIYKNRKKAHSLTGNGMFDLLPEKDLRHYQDSLKESYDEIAKAVEYDPLILVTLNSAYDDA